jgi:hypothetical protein
VRITAEEQPEAVKRYRHVRPAPGWKGRRCAARCLGIAQACTRERGHRGPHVAHGLFFRRIVAVWEADADAGPGRATAPTRRSMTTASWNGEGSRPIGLPQRAPAGLVRAVRDLAARALSSWDQIAFVVLFIVFVKFAIDVLMTLY